MFIVWILVSALAVCDGGNTRIETAIIYDEFYQPSLPSFHEAINSNSLVTNVVEFKQSEMKNIVGEINAAKVSSIFVLTQFINCTAMVELKQAVTVFFIGMVRDHCDPTDNFLLYMYPSHFDVMRAMYDAIDEYGWKTAAVFYDGSDELAFGYQDLDLARQRGVNLKVWVIPEDSDETWAMLKSVRLLGYRTYILVCDYKIAKSLMTKAVFLSMVSEVNHWIVPNLEIHSKLMEDFLESSVRLTLLSAQSIRNVLEYHFIRGSSERVARDATTTAVTTDSLNLMNDACNYAIAEGCFGIPLSDDKQCGIDQGAKSVETSGNFYSLGTCTEIYMRKIKKIGQTKIEFLEHHLGNPKANLSFVGYWKENFVPRYDPFVQAAVVFPEEPLLVGIVYDPPWVRWHVNERTQETTYEGFLMDLLVTLSSQLNFKYKLVHNDTVGPPEKRPNNSDVDQEVDRMLTDKTVEFFLHKRPIHGGNLGHEELSIAFQQVYYYMLTLASGNAAPVNIWQFLAPFTFDSWVVLWVSLVFVSGVLALVNHFNPFEWRKQALDDTNEDVPVENFNKLGLGNSVWMAYAGIVGQGVDIEPLSYAGRIITGTWWYFTMLVIAAYTANLTAFLTQEFAGDIAIVDELIEQEHYSYGVLEDSDIVRYFFPYATSHPYSTAWQYLQQHPNFIYNSSEAILERISEGGFYYLASFAEVAKVEQAGCLYARIGTGFWEYQYGLPFQLGSRYTSVFNDAISSLRDDGTMQELESKWFNFRSECKEASFDIESNRLGIGNLGGMFIFLLIGAILAILVHCGEVLWSKRYRIKKFREMDEKKEKKDDPVSEMKRRREQERKELDDKIEAWEGGYEYWIDRMDHINRTLKVIDDQDKRHMKHMRGESALDSEDEDASGNFSWWTNAFKSVFDMVRKRSSQEVVLDQRTRVLEVSEERDATKETIPVVKFVSMENKEKENGDTSSSGYASSEIPLPVPEEFEERVEVHTVTPAPSTYSETPSEVKSKKVKKMLSFSQRHKPRNSFRRF